MTLNATTTLTMGTPTGVANYLLKTVQDGTGGHPITWTVSSGTLTWVNDNTVPVPPSTVAGTVDFYGLFWDGTNWYGSYGLNYPP